ncbi:MAG: vitamin K epoxide reductase family protein [Gemmatimonadaceae bacterium]
MKASQLSRELRQGQSPDMTRRRWVIGLSFVGVAMGEIVSAYQTGIVKHLPDPSGKLGKVFNATQVDASDYGYQRFDSPDGIMMLALYSTTAWLAAAGGLNRAREKPAIPIAMGLKALYDAVTAVRLAREEWQDNKKLCEYCQVGTAVSLASAALAMPEAIRATRNVLGHNTAMA